MARHAHTASLPFIGTLDRTSRDLGRQLAQALRVAIRNGDLRGGEPLPSTRALAAALGVARGTVVEAFEQLVAEGFLESRRGASTRVMRSALEPRAAAVSERSRPPGRTRALPQATATFTRIADQFSPCQGCRSRSLFQGVRLLPATPGVDSAIESGPGGPPALPVMPESQGVRALREAIAEYVRRSRSVRCDPDQIIITSGTQQGLYLASQVLVGPGDATWVENPAYPALTAILTTTGRGIPDDSGSG